ncbi:MAG: hypothetical protein DHS20C15_05580 [Planctomycetota bacterium]|nr:MAG: hypothetical protein DHS20C15_05580 [Planctomycetota bacterium]
MTLALFLALCSTLTWPGTPPAMATLLLAVPAPAHTVSDVALTDIEAALLARQDRDGGWALHELRRERAERNSARLNADRWLATRCALAALELGTPTPASRSAQARARAWIQRNAAANQVPNGAGASTTGRAAPSSALLPVAQLARLRAAIERAESAPGRLSEDALLHAIESSYRGRHAAELAAARVPRWRADFGLAELELTEALSRAVELLPPAHASRYRSRLLEAAHAAIGADGLVRDPLRAAAVSSVGTARALLVLRRAHTPAS